jgi:hypothetical protein
VQEQRRWSWRTNRCFREREKGASKARQECVPGRASAEDGGGHVRAVGGETHSRSERFWRSVTTWMCFLQCRSDHANPYVGIGALDSNPRDGQFLQLVQPTRTGDLV